MEHYRDFGPSDSSVILVGLLHSLTGTMAISEVSLKEAELLAIDEINQAGGVCGKIIQPIIENGASDPTCFAAQAQKLLQADRVATIFGCWTSASRKAVLPILEHFNGLLWYPVQYEGLECSPHVFYTGACANQQVEPAVNWCLENYGHRFYLIGSDYVFPRTVNQIIKAQLKQHQGITIAEQYIPLGETDFRSVITHIKHTQPHVVFSTLNGDSNLAFYQQYSLGGIAATDIPILAVSVSEEELRLIGESATNHYACWTYFQSLDLPSNQNFVRNFQQRYGQERVTSDPIEAAYSQVYLWKQAVEAAQSFAVDRVRQAAYHQKFLAPGGMIEIATNHHLIKHCRIGKILANGQFEVVFSTPTPLLPQPWLGLESLDHPGVPVAIELLAEVPQAIQYSCELEKKSRDLEAAMVSLKQKNRQLEIMQSQLIAAQKKFQQLAKQEELMRRRLSSQIRNSLDLDTILQTAVTEIRQLLEISRCQFWWYEQQLAESSIELVYQAINEKSVRLFSQPTTLLKPILDQIQQVSLIVWHETAGTEPFDPITCKYFKNLGITALVAIAIPTSAGKTGIIVCQQSAPRHPWTENEIEFIQSIADQLSVAIENAQLYQESQRTATLATAQAEQLQKTLTELKYTQTQLIQTEKMSALGQLVAGIAHEINNPVSFIYGNLVHVDHYIQSLIELLGLYENHYPNLVPEIQAFQEQIDYDYLITDLPQILASMKVGADRIREIILSLRMFSRLDESEIKFVDIHVGIDSALMLLEHRLKSSDPVIEVIKHYGELGLVECYPSQLNQVFINILNNAIDVLNTSQEPLTSPAPTITIQTDKIHCTPGQCAVAPASESQPQCVIICITDNGPGMDTTVKERLFDPFFTTKPVGKGTGLGLSIAYQIIVEKHGGELWCDSVPGLGTTFCIKIPARAWALPISPLRSGLFSPCHRHDSINF